MGNLSTPLLELYRPYRSFRHISVADGGIQMASSTSSTANYSALRGDFMTSGRSRVEILAKFLR